MRPRYISSSERDFIASLNGSLLPLDFSRVKWTLPRYLHGEYRPHKKALREFLTLLNITPTQSILKDLVVDKDGTEIILNKPKDSDGPTPYLSELEDIINSVKLPTQRMQD